jgi:SNF2 family DNA or RNA helicase
VAVQNQATDRAHRIGQRNAVTVYKLIAKGSIEENILRLQEKKKELAEQLLGNDGFEAVKITKEDMLRLLAGT